MKSYTPTHEQIYQEIAIILNAIESSLNNKVQNKGNLLKFEETCTYLSMPPGQLRKLVFEKRVPVTRLGKSLRFSRTDLDEWIADNTEYPKELPISAQEAPPWS